MAVISITVSESPLQKLANIPAYLTLSTNIPATIFYTIDGSDPDTSSSVYIDEPVYLPTDQGSLVIFKAFATDGVDSSSIVEKEYSFTIVGDRVPRNTITNLGSTTMGASYPFGSQDQRNINARYGAVGGVIIDAANDDTNIPDGYDGTATGTPSNYTDKPVADYANIFSETNAIGETGRGIGTLPAEVAVVIPPNQSNAAHQLGSGNTASAFFNPKALVIYDDARQTPYDPDISRINRPYFTTEDPTKVNYGSQMNTTAFESQAMRGSALVPQYNSKEQTITYYYHDGNTNRWIISKVPFIPAPQSNNFSQVVYGRDRGVGKIFKWLPFMYRTLI